MTGLAPVLDSWAVGRACRDHAQLRVAFGGEPRIAVNISAGHLGDPGFEDMVLSAVAAHSVGVGGLILEVTESALMEDPARAGALLQRLRDRGGEASMDDFRPPSQRGHRRLLLRPRDEHVAKKQEPVLVFRESVA